MSNRVTKRKDEQISVEMVHRVLRAGPLTTQQVRDRLGISHTRANNLLRSMPGVHRGKIGAQKLIWSLE